MKKNTHPKSAKTKAGKAKAGKAKAGNAKAGMAAESVTAAEAVATSASEPQVYGYARVSTSDQNAARQVASLTEAGIPSSAIFVEKFSGKDFDRPVWQELKAVLRSRDTIVVTSIDRFGRDYTAMKLEWHDITMRIGARVRVLDNELLSSPVLGDESLETSLMRDILFGLHSFNAQRERDNIRTRQAQGIAVAKANGVQFGRPHSAPDLKLAQLAAEVRSGGLALRKAARRSGLPYSTFRDRIAKLGV